MKFKWMCCGLMLLCAVSANAQEASQSKPHKHAEHTEQRQKEDKSQEQSKRLAIPDVEVLNQDGEKRKFYTDMVKGKIVVVNFIYTSCKAMCPLSGDNFARLQTLLGTRLGKDVYLLSITTDPETDSPQKLKTWSERFKPKAGWDFITGDMEAMQTLLLALTGERLQRGFHTPVALLIKDGGGAWKRTYGLEPPARFVNMLDELSAQH
jgi:Uncharacterized protein SCO1/SenC/PrrC, involved in biogenesis of respiratory and photosynthetic systems